MSYIEKRLFPEEEICYRGQFHWIHTWAAWFALFALGIFLIGIYLFISILVRINTTEFVVTSRRVVLKKGLFNAKLRELDLDAIEGGSTHQSFFGRIFGYGDVKVFGRGDTTIDFPVMAYPGKFLSEIEKARLSAEEAPMELLSEELEDKAVVTTGNGQFATG